MNLPDPDLASTLAVALSASAADTLPLGIVKIGPDEAFVYANREMLRIGGLDDWRGKTLAHVFRAEELEKVRSELRKRLKTGVTSAYRANLTRPDDTVVPISITAFPEVDADGRVLCSTALVRDRTLEMAQQQMYGLVERESDRDRLMDAIGRAVAPLVPFDRLEVFRLNQERTHLRPIYSREGHSGITQRTFRWWLIPEPMRSFLNGERLLINDLRAWYGVPERAFMLEKQEVRDFLDQGFVSVLSLPVSQDGEQVASLVLSRKTGRPFTLEEEAVADALPLTEAASVALRQETEGNLHFLLKLMSDISIDYESVADVALTIVQRIREHYGWDYVSIYEVHPAEIRLIAQAAKSEKLRSKTLAYSIEEESILRLVSRSKQSFVHNNLDAPELSGVRIPRRHKTLSELCVPIGKDARWLLNVEDEKTDAFAPEEKADLEAIAGGLSSLLKRTREYHYRSAVVSSANDAIFLVDELRVVFEANAAAARLLRLDNEQIRGRPIADFFIDAEEARVLLTGGSFPNHEVRMRRSGAGGEAVKVLLSVAKLPNEIGAWIFIASDMTQLERAKDLELAQGLYREIAGQVKTPMSLAISWLRRHAQREVPGGDDLARKAVQQLQKAELTLDRLMLVEPNSGAVLRHEVLISIDDFIESVLLELPERERLTIETRGEAGPVLIRADAYELRYCLLTVLSYLLRLAAEVDRIGLEVRVEGGEVAIVVSGRADAVQPDIAAECRSGQARAEMGLGRETLGRLAERNHGRYTESAVAPGGKGRAAFGFAFATVAEGGGR